MMLGWDNEDDEILGVRASWICRKQVHRGQQGGGGQ